MTTDVEFLDKIIFNEPGLPLAVRNELRVLRHLLTNTETATTYDIDVSKHFTMEAAVNAVKAGKFYQGFFDHWSRLVSTLCIDDPGSVLARLKEWHKSLPDVSCIDELLAAHRDRFETHDVDIIERLLALPELGQHPHGALYNELRVMQHLLESKGDTAVSRGVADLYARYMKADMAKSPALSTLWNRLRERWGTVSTPPPHNTNLFLTSNTSETIDDLLARHCKRCTASTVELIDKILALPGFRMKALNTTAELTVLRHLLTNPDIATPDDIAYSKNFVVETVTSTGLKFFGDGFEPLWVDLVKALQPIDAPKKFTTRRWLNLEDTRDIKQLLRQHRARFQDPIVTAIDDILPLPSVKTLYNTRPELLVLRHLVLHRSDDDVTPLDLQVSKFTVKRTVDRTAPGWLGSEFVQAFKALEAVWTSIDSPDPDIVVAGNSLEHRSEADLLKVHRARFVDPLRIVRRLLSDFDDFLRHWPAIRRNLLVVRAHLEGTCKDPKSLAYAVYFLDNCPGLYSTNKSFTDTWLILVDWVRAKKRAVAEPDVMTDGLLPDSDDIDVLLEAHAARVTAVEVKDEVPTTKYSKATTMPPVMLKIEEAYHHPSDDDPTPRCIGQVPVAYQYQFRFKSCDLVAGQAVEVVTFPGVRFSWMGILINDKAVKICHGHGRMYMPNVLFPDLDVVIVVEIPAPNHSICP